MFKKIKCANCGKDVDCVCAVCWRCKDCKLDCKKHMKRTIDGIVGENHECKKLAA